MGNVNFFSNGHTHNAYSNALDPNKDDEEEDEAADEEDMYVCLIDL